VTDHELDGSVGQLASGIQYMLQQGLSGKLMQHFRSRRVHSRAFAGCEYNYVDINHANEPLSFYAGRIVPQLH